ncbi:MAG: hypothetical protein HY650_04380 [Acidobacteria bacterium]|nr:hypothetical protein [Acidobacteriota bacterium]
MKRIAAMCGLLAPFLAALPGADSPALVLVLFYLGFGQLLIDALPLLATVLAVLVIFGPSININVDFVALLL